MTHYRYLPYTLTLQSPAVVTALGGDANSSSTLPYIPGSAVRGAVARALGDPGMGQCKQQDFHDLVLGGKVRYLNAYPSAEGRRAVPVPVSYRLKKNETPRDNRVSVFDLAAFDGHPAAHGNQHGCWPGEQLAPLSHGFFTLGEAQPLLVQAKMSSRIHHQRDRNKGRAWKDSEGKTHGAIFAFESLDAGQSFQGVIQLCGNTEEELAETERRIKTLLGDIILVGRSRRAGYGGWATIQWENIRNREIEGSGTEGLRPVTDRIPQGASFRLLFTSACIARDAATGQINPTAAQDLVERSLRGRAKVIRRRWSFEVLGGFNRKWRLELPQVLAVSAGSVFVLEAEADISVSDLYKIENEGLGERKEEGYGRVLFLDKPLPRLSLREPEENPSERIGSNQAPPLVSNIEARIIWAQVARKIEEKAADLAATARDLPTNSLIGRLRVPLRRRPEEAYRTLTAWLSSEKEAERLKPPAMEQLERCRMDGNLNLATWIRNAFDRDKVLNWLNADVIAQRCYIISKESARKVLEERPLELSVKLIDAVLAALAVRNKTKEAGNGR